MSRPVGGVLFTEPLPATRSVTIHLCGLPGTTEPKFEGGQPVAPSDLAPNGVYLADRVAPVAGALLPHRFTLTLTASGEGGLFSVALSCGFPRLAVSQHPVLRSPDLPQLVLRRTAVTRSTHPNQRRYQLGAGEGG